MMRRIRLHPSEMSPDLLRAVQTFERTHANTDVELETKDVTLVVGIVVKEVIIRQSPATVESPA
ncbi:MAG TPA: hypothetical protein VMU12_02130 [Candidatus Paceibacterota bacterium]|nr:hypothetical protein [Candidatus Paceibacterota bacterium]